MVLIRFISSDANCKGDSNYYPKGTYTTLSEEGAFSSFECGVRGNNSFAKLSS